MEYFDFDGAASDFQNVDDVASDYLELDEEHDFSNFGSPIQEQSFEGCNGAIDRMTDQHLGDDAALSLGIGVQPMFKAKEPCDFCQRMGFDCFVAHRGLMQNGCSCCISFHNKCSLTHAKVSEKHFDILYTVSENADDSIGDFNGKRADSELDLRRRGSSRFSRETIRVLKTWLREHIDHPYPSEEEKGYLEKRTGLKKVQICNWLANARRRGKGRSAPRNASTVTKAIDIRQSVDLSTMTPLERWKFSPPENEPASTTDIIRALENTPIEPNKSQRKRCVHAPSLSRRTGSSNDSSCATSDMFKAPSVSSFETSRSSISDLSFASAFSHRSSLGSFGSMDRQQRRRRRRKVQGPINSFNSEKARSARIFQCTFCTDSFAAKYDWQRHEKSLHLALDKWTCSPKGGVVTVNGTSVCIFCQAPDPDFDHLESHNYSICHEKEPDQRTFYRKDHLNQHLRLIHNAKYHSSMDGWRSSTTEIKSRCGFCATTFTTWNDRVEHLAAHFKSGSDMSQWQGDWGFEPSIQARVENSMPPYLIWEDRMTLDPWKPSRRTNGSLDSSGGTSPRLDFPHDQNCFRRLERELTAYIQDQVAAGVSPTDQMIQDQARIVIYGSDDPWNQTCADNAAWLSILKRDAGLEPVPHSDHIQLDNLGMQPPFALSGGLRSPPVETNPGAQIIHQQALNDRGATVSGFEDPSNQLRAGNSMWTSSSNSNSSSSDVGPNPNHTAGLSSNGPNNFHGGPTSFSISADDPFVQMGFDPAFLQRLSEGYDAFVQQRDLK